MLLVQSAELRRPSIGEVTVANGIRRQRLGLMAKGHGEESLYRSRSSWHKRQGFKASISNFGFYLEFGCVLVKIPC
jgi:hypothetical protein